MQHFVLILTGERVQINKVEATPEEHNRLNVLSDEKKTEIRLKF